MSERANEVTELKRRLAQALREKEQLQEVCRPAVMRCTGCATEPHLPACVFDLGSRQEFLPHYNSKDDALHSERGRASER